MGVHGMMKGRDVFHAYAGKTFEYLARPWCEE
jgi:hypothetical protein